MFRDSEMETDIDSENFRQTRDSEKCEAQKNPGRQMDIL